MDQPTPQLEHTGADNNATPSAVSGRAGLVAVPRFEQLLASSSSSSRSTTTSSTNIETMSHAHTSVLDSKQGEEEENKRAQSLAAGSVYSYNSTRDVREFVKEVYGRVFNSLNDTYLLPTDEAEWGRLDKQHSALLICFGGLYPCPEIVEAVLAPSESGVKQVLDVGCGTGSWAIQMAIRYPHCAVKGVDLAPVPQDAINFPPNVNFEIDNINHGLEHFYEQYDLVHMRCVKSGITDIAKTLEDLQRCLRPGGLLIIIDADTEQEDGNHNKLKMAKVEGDEDVSGVSEDGSWFQRVFWEGSEACVMAGSDFREASRRFDLGLWDSPLCDPDTALSGSVYTPIGAWSHASNATADQELKYVGILMRQVCLNIHRAFHAILLRNGMTQDVLDQWAKAVDNELETIKKKMWIRFQFCIARRRAGPNLPAPPLREQPTLPTTSRYPAIEIFRTAQEALAAREARLHTSGTWPTSAVRRASATAPVEV